MKPKLLILDDDEVFSATLARSLGRRGLEATVAATGEDALRAASAIPFDYATIDLHLANDSGLQWIAPLRKALPHARLLVLTGYASIATTVQAIKLGADDYLAKPVNVDSILSALQFNTEAAPEAPVQEEFTPLTVDRLEWEHIQRVLAEHQGNISSTARALNMHRRTLQRKLMKKPVGK
ncbi:response regulator transcription factor [Noviherbaspirillum sp.]|uniref:response regulator transcription factor n=1 Tax=Noviherbaspirillum sp. TaxID=1926288 RepID=UPI002D2281EC|nr:response regulator transcription factor [Noviherbaspirillum sp.]HZW22461.1 response regulator transcription factor [Noviherbaspirillum sp.]